MFLYRSCLLVFFLGCGWIFPEVAAGETPLHERIDAVLAQSQIGPPAALAGDAEFLRRIYLDLTGRIPSAETARKFLADTSPEKRRRLIEELFQHPATNRHLAKVLDIMLMERRPDKNVKGAEWDAYLLAAMRDNKPWNELAREILAADGADSKHRAPAKFYLDREDVSVNLITRDTARVFFGRNIECAQCHDHPLISDYEQSEYYGMLAFLNRSSLFQPDKKKPAIIAETAEGLVKFKSVFTGYEGETLPRLPGEQEIAEPTFKKGEEYQVKPAKNVRPVPKYSRRQKLAELATAGTNEAFNKNIANRLWAVMMGQGLVDPVDLHHSDNPPASPELLALLAKEFPAMQFDIKKFLQEIALSQTYQRSFHLPESFAENVAMAQKRFPQIQAEQTRQKQQAESFAQPLEQLEASIKTHREAAKPIDEKLKAAKTQLAAAEKSLTSAQTALMKLQQSLATKQQIANLLTEAAVQAKLAAQKLPADKLLSKAIAGISAQSLVWTKQIAGLKTQCEQQTAVTKTAETKLAAVNSEMEPIQAELAKIEAVLQKTEAEYAAAREKKRTALAAVDALDRDLQRLNRLLEYAKASQELAAARSSARLLETQLVAAQTETALQESPETASHLDAAQKPAQAELAKVEEAFAIAEAALAKSWTQHFRVAGMEQLSPEQLAWSVLEAVGQVDQQKTAALALWNKQHADLKGKTLSPEQQSEQAEFIEQTLRTKLAGSAAKFLPLFAASAGQPQHEFFATVEQALFFANGNDVLAWLRPGGGNLTDRLRKIKEPKPLAEELYLSILTRLPTAEEIHDVADYLSEREKDRDQAIQEIAWALLTSAEFRFQH